MSDEPTTLEAVLASEAFRTAVQAEVDKQVEGLKTKNGELLTEVKKWKRKARDGDDAGSVELEEWRDRATSIEAELKKARELRDKDKDTAAKQVQALAAQLDAAVIDSEVTRAVASHKGVTDLLAPYVRARVARKEVDGKQVPVVLGEDGQPRLKEGATNGTDFLTVADFVGSLKEQDGFKGAFQGTGAAGSGTLPGSRPGGDAVIPNTPEAITQNLDKVASGEVKVAT